ncbi:MAG: ATP-dependent DNA helicase [Candidatus Tokpelaia sp.]|nr:MAG: ATP-dependent DNA helicase [Candidatus Tokpelaia sp.]KAA6405911.1 ATP-dependent DNA helicase [Candidatus Tokpelaia sp.]
MPDNSPPANIPRHYESNEADQNPAENVADGSGDENSAVTPQPAVNLAERAIAARGLPPVCPNFSLKNLNPQQREAVETTEGPLLVLAGAGTGKTRVLTTRIAYILAQKLAAPKQILAVTFTNKAASEMKERIGRLVGEAVQAMPWLGTFHALGAKFLRIHAELAELKPDFTILDSDDVQRLLKQLIRAEGLDDKRWPARSLAHKIDEWKNKGWTPERVPEGDARSFGDGKGRILYQAYQERLKTTNSCDFGDLLLLPIAVFKKRPDILAKYQQKFRYILVDEYQDTNLAQYLWLRLLAQRLPNPQTGERQSVNLCCVGDDDQSIYGWRGAEVDNILRFEHDFPGAKLIRLERNYRSTAPILATASHLIAYNQGRLGKTLFPDKVADDAAKVRLYAAWDSQEEARAIGDEIEALLSSGTALGAIAILVRASFQTREFEERFGIIGLDYRIIGGQRFYERQEIRDAIAYLRVAAQPADDMAFERIFNLPKRGLGDACLRRLHDTARRLHMPLLAAAAELIAGTELPAKQRSALREVVENFRRWRNIIDTTAPAELAQIILDESGYTEMWQNDKSADAAGRLENLKELARSMEGFENLRGFLEHIALVMENDNRSGREAVNIMTLHAAKGLEFDAVFLPGWEEGLFPHQRALDEGGKKGLEEERRLAYVGLTRARQREYIWFSQNRRIHGLWQNTMPSRFLGELPEEQVEIMVPDNSYGGYAMPYTAASGHTGSAFHMPDPFGGNYQTPGFQRGKRNATEATRNNWGRRSGADIETGIERGKSATDRTPLLEERILQQGTGGRKGGSGKTAAAGLKPGDRVFHLKFGNGTISAMEDDKLTVDFDKAGQKRVLAGYVEKL